MSWSPNQDYLNALIGMGINKAAAEQVLLFTVKIFKVITAKSFIVSA